MKTKLLKQLRSLLHKELPKNLTLLLLLIFMLKPLTKPQPLKIKLSKLERLKSPEQFHIPETLEAGN